MDDEGSGQVRFLIVGVARSGTTLTQRLASELDGVWVPPETHFWRHAHHLAERFSWPLSPDDVDAAIEEMRNLPGLDRYLQEIETLEGLPSEPLLWDLFTALTRAGVPADTKIIGEKTPNHVRWVSRLLAEIPQLAVVGVRRDALSTFASHARVPWGVREAERFAFRHRMADEALLTAKHAFPERVLLFDHAAMAAEPARAQDQIAALLGVDPTARTHEPLDGLIAADEPWKADAIGEIVERPPNREGLSDDEVAALETALRGWDSDLVGSGIPGSESLADERGAYVAASAPLPISQSSLSAWHISAPVRSRAWEARASTLNTELERSKARADSWQERATTLNTELERSKARADSWQERATELNQQVAAWRSQANELGETFKAEQARVRSWNERAVQLQTELSSARADLDAAAAARDAAHAELKRRWTKRLRRFARRSTRSIHRPAS